MKKVSKFTKIVLIGLVVSIFSLTGAMAQQGNGNGQGFNRGNGNPGMCRGMANFDLTADQQTKMQALQTKHMKEIQPLRNQLDEKQAHLNTLRSAEKPDMNAINQQLKDISDLKLKMAQSREAHIQDVRSILTDDQRVKFDARGGKGQFGKGNCKGGRGNGNGFGNGNGPFCPNK
jgi:Spy/CpxP family protein refolding chaperone